MLAMIALAATGAIVLLNLQPFPEARAYYDIYFSGSVQGLKVNAPVSLSGIAIGRVRKIEIDHEDPSLVHVTVEVRKDAAIKSDSVASLDINFMFGDASINISPGSNLASPLPVLPGHAYPLISSQPSQLQSAATWVANFIERSMKGLDALIKMLDDESRQAISEGLQTAEQATARAVGQTQDFGNAIDTADSMVRNAHAQVIEANASLLNMTQGISTAKSNVDDMDAVVKEVGDWVRNFDNTSSAALRQQVAAARTNMSDLQGMVSEWRDLIHRFARYIDDMQRGPTRALFGKPGSSGYRPK